MRLSQYDVAVFHHAVFFIDVFTVLHPKHSFVVTEYIRSYSTVPCWLCLGCTAYHATGTLCVPVCDLLVVVPGSGLLDVLAKSGTRSTEGLRSKISVVCRECILLYSSQY